MVIQYRDYMIFCRKMSNSIELGYNIFISLKLLYNSDFFDVFDIYEYCLDFDAYFEHMSKNISYSR